MNEMSTAAEITGDGQYEVEWFLSGEGTDALQFIAVCISPSDVINNFTSDEFSELSITIDEIWIDGVRIEDYSTSEGAVNTNYYETGKGITRIYLRDEWAGTGTEDLSADTTITESIKAVFTVSGISV